MKTQIDKHTFVTTFDKWGRGDNFSVAAREALFEYYEELEDDMGEEIEFDPIAICCDWSEYESAIDCLKDYSHKNQGPFSAWIDDEQKEEACIEYLRDETQVIEFDGGILVCSF